MVMVIHCVLLKTSLPHVGKARVVVMVIHRLPLKSFPPLLGMGSDGGHGHTHPSPEKLSSLRNLRGWWSWSYTFFFCKASLLFWEREGMVLRIVVGAPAVVVYLLEVGLGHLADLRPTAPSLATLAVDRQALLLDKEASNQVLTSRPLLACEGVVVMVTNSLPLKSSPSLLGNGRDGGHGHTHPSSEKLSSSSQKGKG